MGEIYEFPKNKDVTKPTSHSEFNDSIEQFRMGYIDDVSEFLLNVIMSEITRGGFSVSEEDTDDVVLILESIRSLMMKKQGFDHPLQEVAQNVESSFNDENNITNKDEETI